MTTCQRIVRVNSVSQGILVRFRRLFTGFSATQQKIEGGREGRSLVALLFIMCWPLAVQGAELGDDGLHKAPWMRDTFKDLSEDLAEANAEGKRLLLMFEQRGCIYCTKLHEEVFPATEINQTLSETYFVVQLNLHGDVEVTDFDGETLSEKAMARKWGILFTPTLMFIDETVEEVPAPQATVAMMPGAFGKGTTLDMLTWVAEKRYLIEDGEDFQRYHARRIQERDNGSAD